jgi:hypothetical protein
VHGKLHNFNQGARVKDVEAQVGKFSQSLRRSYLLTFCRERQLGTPQQHFLQVDAIGGRETVLQHSVTRTASC